MTLSHVDDVEHWRERAAQVRVLATTMKQIEAQAVMVRLAKDYDKLADRAELRANAEIPQQAGRRVLIPGLPHSQLEQERCHARLS
jgi:hypothetical protein